jgi:hypothetical protein
VALAVLIVLVVLAGAGMVLAFHRGIGGMSGMHRRFREQAEAEAKAVVEAGGRAERAESLGQKSRNWMQLVGPGMLMLSGDELRFRVYASGRLTRIPLAAIESVRTRREHWMEPSAGSHLLVVLWRVHGGQDGMGFEVPDRDGWVAALGGER